MIFCNINYVGDIKVLAKIYYSNLTFIIYINKNILYARVESKSSYMSGPKTTLPAGRRRRSAGAEGGRFVVPGGSCIFQAGWQTAICTRRVAPVCGGRQLRSLHGRGNVSHHCHSTTPVPRKWWQRCW